MAADAGKIREPTDIASFGDFQFSVFERWLKKNGEPVNLGARALDILAVLVERPGEVVPKKELIVRVWPDTIVDEGSLRFHVASLRKALADNRNDVRFISTIGGRGYCFVAPVSFETGPAAPARKEQNAVKPQTLPNRPQRMVGRDDAVREISDALLQERFVTIVGPGGIGKTTVGVSVAHNLLPAFENVIYFFDLGPLGDPRLVPSAVASILKLMVQSDDPIASVIAFLRNKRILLILDSCEHVIDSAAMLAETIFTEAPEVHILATSREALRVEGERVFPLSPLECPPEDSDFKPSEILSFPASQLFIDRMGVTGRDLDLSKADAQIIGDICRRLDGIALAIELAAGGVNAFGLKETSKLLNSRFRLLLQGRRTALPRHQTLNATLDWSYDLLSEREHMILRRLSVFVGTFTLDAAEAVGSCDKIDASEVVSIIASLVGKSLVVADTSYMPPRYRLLDTTRAYVLQKLVESGEANNAARRHAAYFSALLEDCAVKSKGAAEGNIFGTIRDQLGNVRAALEWGFMDTGDIQIGISLASVAAQFFLEMSLLAECARWTERAIAELDEDTIDTSRELDLQAALGLSLMFAQGNSESARVALNRALSLAEKLDDLPNQLRLLGRLQIFNERVGQFYKALEYAKRGLAVAKSIRDPIAIAEAHSALGISLHLEGNNEGARANFEASLVDAPSSVDISSFHFGFDFRNRSKIGLARTLWLEGHADKATTLARQAVAEAEALDHPVTLCIALIWAVTIFIWCGDLTSADEYIDRFIVQANRHSLGPYQAVGHCVKGELSIKRGDGRTGIKMLRESLTGLHEHRYELLTTEFNAALAEGLASIGRFPEAITTISEAIKQVDENGDLYMKAELLRVKGSILASKIDPDFAEAEAAFQSALEIAAQQGALSWQLRATISLATLWSSQGRREHARDLLAVTYHRVSEGFETSDCRAASSLLREWSADK